VGEQTGTETDMSSPTASSSAQTPSIGQRPLCKCGGVVLANEHERRTEWNEKGSLTRLLVHVAPRNRKAVEAPPSRVHPSYHETLWTDRRKMLGGPWRVG